MPFSLEIKRISEEVTSQMIRDALGENMRPDKIEIMMDGTAIIEYSDVSLFNQITMTFPTLALRIGSTEYKLELPKNSQATIVLNRVPIYISEDVLQAEVNKFLRKRGLKPCIANIFQRKVKSQSANLVFLGSHDAQAAMKVLGAVDFTREITASCGLGHLTVIETDIADQRHGRSNEGEVFQIVARCYDQSVVQEKAEENEMEIKKQQDNLTSELKINQLNPLGQELQPSILPGMNQPLIQSMAAGPMQQYVESQQPLPYEQVQAFQTALPQFAEPFQAESSSMVQPLYPASEIIPGIAGPPPMNISQTQPESKPSNTSVYVANVPASVPELAVKEAFEPFGPVLTSYKIYNGKTPFACYIIEFKDTVTAPSILEQKPNVTIGETIVQIRPHITKAKR